MDFLAHTLQLLPNLPVVGFASLTATRQISATAVVTRIKNFMSEEEKYEAKKLRESDKLVSLEPGFKLIPDLTWLSGFINNDQVCENSKDAGSRGLPPPVTGDDFCDTRTAQD